MGLLMAGILYHAEATRVFCTLPLARVHARLIMNLESNGSEQFEPAGNKGQPETKKCSLAQP